MDRALPRLLGMLAPGEVCAITADHGCDPTTPVHPSLPRVRAAALSTPPAAAGCKLGPASFADLGATVSEFFDLRPDVGTSFLAAPGR